MVYNLLLDLITRCFGYIQMDAGGLNLPLSASRGIWLMHHFCYAPY